MYKIKILGIIVCLFVFCRVSGQIGHELHLQVNGGLSTLQYKMNQGSAKVGFGAGGGIGYTVMLHENWGIGLDANFSLLTTSLNMAGTSAEIPNLTDEYKDKYDFLCEIRTYNEKIRTMMVNIPLSLQFRTGVKNQFYFRLGFQVGIPVQSTFSLRGAEYTNSAYYPIYDNRIYAPEFMGYGDFDNRTANGKIKLNLSYSLVAELGVKWEMSSKMSLYTGLFANYGFNNMRKPKDDIVFVNLDKTEPINFTTNSITHALSGSENSFVKKVSSLAVGVNVRVALDFSSDKVSVGSKGKLKSHKHTPNSPTQKKKFKKHKKQVHTQKRKTRKHSVRWELHY